MICKQQLGSWMRLVATLAIVGALLTTTALPAQAELFLDAYIGGSFSSDGETTSQGLDNTNLNLDDAVLVGGRLGYWLGFFPYLGVALDVSLFTTDLDSLTDQQTFENADLKHIPLSGLAMLRFPLLTSATVPQGHIQPYVAAGPTLFLSDLDLEERNISKEDIGLDVRAGLGLRLNHLFGVFAEYRFTYVDQTFPFSREGVSSVIETDPSTHHILAGISLRF